MIKRNQSFSDEELGSLRNSLINLYKNAGKYVASVLLIFLLADLVIDFNTTIFQKISTIIPIVVLGSTSFIPKSKLYNVILLVHVLFISGIASLVMLDYMFNPNEEHLLTLFIGIILLSLAIVRTRMALIYFGVLAMAILLISLNYGHFEFKYVFYFLISAVSVSAINYWRETLYRKSLAAHRTYKNMFSQSSELIFVLDEELKILEMNKAAEDYVSSQTVKNLYGETFNDLFCGESENDVSNFERGLKKAKNNEEAVRFEALCDFNDDEDFVPKEFTISKADYFNEEVYVISIRIIKELKEHELQLIESKEKISQVLENINSFIFNISYDVNGINLVNYVSPKVEQIYGVDFGEYIARAKMGRVSELFHPDDRERVNKDFEQILKTLEPGILRFRMVRNGETHWIEEKIFPKKKDKNAPITLFGIVTDITDRVESLRLLEDSEKRYRQIFERNLAGVYKTHLNGTILDCNPAFARILGYDSADEIKTLNVEDIYFNYEERSPYLEKLKQEGSLNNLVTYLKTKSGKRLTVNNNVSIFPDENGELNIIEGTLIDITELEETSKALRVSEGKYKLLFEQASNAILLISFEHDQNPIVDANDVGCELFGLKYNELVGLKLSDVSAQDKDTENKLRVVNKKLSEDGKIETEWKFMTNEGRSFDAEVSFVSVKLGNEQVVQVVIKDISDRKKYEQELLDSRKSFKNIVDNSPAAIMIFTNKELVYLNPHAEKLYESHLNSNATDLLDIFPREHRFLLEDLLKDAENDLNSYTEINLGEGEDQKNYSINIVNTIYNNKNAQLILLRDITLQNEYNVQKLRAEVAEDTNKMLQEEIDRHKITQASLIEKTSRLNALFKGSDNLYIISLDRDYKLTSFNDNFEKLVSEKLNKKAKNGELFIDYFESTPEARESIYKKFTEVFQGKPHEIISHFPGNDGEIWMESFINPIVIEGQEIKEISFISHDITEKIESERKIKQSEANNRAILLAMPDILFKVNKEGFFTDAKFSNEQDKTLLREITKTLDLPGKQINEVFNEPQIADEILRHVHLALETKQVVTHTFSFYYGEKERNNKVYFENRYSQTNDEEVIVISRNVTESVEHEDQLLESVREKEVLLKEVHHRVKNNLQVINSILNLQSSYVDDQKTLEIINESQNRIRSMSYIHEILYQTKNFSHINFSDYITNLVQNIVHSYEIFNEQTQLNLDIHPVHLALDQAIPCGLILNELVSNSLKYAYPGDRKGKISIYIREIEQKVHIIIEDFGVGLPEDFSVEESESLGLSLVHTLVEQLDGQLILETGSGTKFLIIFEKQEF